MPKKTDPKITPALTERLDPLLGRSTIAAMLRAAGLRAPAKTIFGHGQQLAAKRLMRIYESQGPAPLPSAETPRQALRRAAFKGVKKAMLVQRERDASAALAAARAAITRPVVQGPGNLRPLAAYDKPHGQAFRQVRTLAELPNGDSVPAGCEATFHNTKGLRVQRTAA